MILPALIDAVAPEWRPIEYSLSPSLGLATLPAYPDADDEVESVVIQVYATSARRSHEIADAYRRRGVRGDGGTARDVDSTRGRRPPRQRRPGSPQTERSAGTNPRFRAR